MSKKGAPMTSILAVTILLAALPALAGVNVNGKAATASRGFPSVVILEPAGGTAAAASGSPAPVEMDQIDKSFQPNVLVARVGQPVIFKNGESLLHNIHVYDMDSDETVLNVAQPIEGMQTEHRFDKPGTYAVLCDVHPEMEAYIVIVDTPYAAVAERDGSFALDVPPGKYSMTVWSVDKKKRRNRTVEITAAGELTLER